MSVVAFSHLKQFVEARLSPEGEWGLHVTVGGVMMALAAWLFGSIADSMVEAQQLVQLDDQIATWFHEHARDGWTRAVLVFTDLHGVAAMSVLGALLGAYFWWKKAPYWLLATAVGIPGGMLLNVLLKSIFMRARPSFHDPILTLSTYSFPSGHTAASTMFYGLLAAYLVCLTPRRWVQVAIVSGAVLMVVLVGISRMYLGAHYFSDVLAAAAESACWLAVCITAGSTLRRRRAMRADQ